MIATNHGDYPIHRIFCVGRNYADHAAEMGHEVDREAPFYFMKDASSLAPDGPLPFPPGTQDLHHEVELVAALNADLFNADTAQAARAVWGYGVGLDMTRRDLQAQAKDKRRSWDLGKNFENSAILGPLTDAATFGDIGTQAITLAVNGEMRQTSDLSKMIWSVPEVIAYLSRYYHLTAGDIIMTGTPAGVGPVIAGDVMTAQIDGLAPLEARYLA
jgi:fumarylpyruvate hydrolase